jgi:hypothetical protein
VHRTLFLVRCTFDFLNGEAMRDVFPVTILERISFMRRITTAAAILLASATLANAANLTAGQARSLALRDQSVVVYYTATDKGFEVVTTVATDAGSPVRFTHVLADGGVATLEVGGDAGTPAAKLVIAREGDSLKVEATPRQTAELN